MKTLIITAMIFMAFSSLLAQDYEPSQSSFTWTDQPVPTLLSPFAVTFEQQHFVLSPMWGYAKTMSSALDLNTAMVNRSDGGDLLKDSVNLIMRPDYGNALSCQAVEYSPILQIKDPGSFSHYIITS